MSREGLITRVSGWTRSISDRFLSSEHHPSRRPPYGRSAVIGVAMAIVPVVLNLVLVATLFDASIGDFLVACTGWLNDEGAYWRMARVFSEFGFGAGMHTSMDLDGPTTWARFSVHGPLFPMLAGTFGKSIGWPDYAPILFNAFWVLVGCVTFGVLVRPRSWAPAALWLSTFWPLSFFLFSGMQESLNHAFAIAIAGCLVVALRDGPSGPGALRAVAVALVVVAALFRFTWGLTLLAVLLVTDESPTWKSVARYTTLAITLTVAAWAVCRFALCVSFPFTRGPLSAAGLSEFIALLGPNAIDNVRALWFFVPAVTWMQKLLLVQVIVALAWLGVCGARGNLHSQNTKTSLVVWSTLGVMLLLNLFLYNVHLYRGYRVLAPYLLMIGLMLAGLGQRRRLIAVLLGLNIVTIPAFTNDYRATHGIHYAYQQDSLERFAEIVSSHVQFRADADKWDNTMIIGPFDRVVLFLPEGIGVSHTPFDRIDELGQPFVLRSRYALLSEEAADRLRLYGQLRKLTATPYGHLYLNVTGVRD